MFDIAPALDCGGRRLVLDVPRVMGIVNVTPDSFSDGGRHFDADAAVAHGLRLVEAGAGLINDVFALRRDGALETAASLGVPVVLMHMLGEPRSMQDDPRYDDVVADVHRFLAERIFAAEMAGIGKQRIVVDPGFGFGKTLEHNLQLLARFERFTELGVPVLAGLSRKRTIGELTGRKAPEERVAGSVAAHLIAVQRGARIVRVHDVAETVDALRVWNAVAAQPVPKAVASTPAIRWPDDD